MAGGYAHGRNRRQKYIFGMINTNYTPPEAASPPSSFHDPYQEITARKHILDKTYTDTIWDDLDLRGTVISNSFFDRLTATDTILCESEFLSSKFRGALFEDCDLDDVFIKDSIWSITRIHCGKISRVTLDNATFWENIVSGVMSGWVSRSSTYVGCNWSDSSIAGCSFTYDQMDGVVWGSACVQDTVFHGVVFRNCDLSEAEFIDCEFADCEFVDCTKPRCI